MQIIEVQRNRNAVYLGIIDSRLQEIRRGKMFRTRWNWCIEMRGETPPKQHKNGADETTLRKKRLIQRFHLESSAKRRASEYVSLPNGTTWNVKEVEISS